MTYVCSFFVHRLSRFARENSEKKETVINARLCKSMLLHTYNHCVWNKKRNPTSVWARAGGWASEWSRWMEVILTCVADWSCEWACEVASDGQTDRQTDRQIERER